MLTFVLFAFTCIYEEHYEYQYDKNSPHVFAHVLGGIPCKGYINENGYFIPDIKDFEKNYLKIKRDGWVSAVSGPPPYGMSMKTNEPVYEYRSGCLIPMIADQNHGLIPEVGGKIIDFKDYVYSPTARRIYNLPGRFVLKKDEPAKK